MNLTDFSTHGIILFGFAAIVAFVRYLYVKRENAKDEAIRQLHDDVGALVKEHNALKLDFNTVSTEHKTGYPQHQKCLEKLTEIEITEKLKGGGQ